MAAANDNAPSDGAVRARARWGSLTRERVVETALRLVEDGGYEQLTVRRLAQEMGVAPMALYHHVKNKDDVLDEVVDRLLERAWRPRTSMGKGPRKWLIEAADRLRQLLVGQPAALHVYLSHPVSSPAALARMEQMLEALELGGLDRRRARRAYAALHSYTVGFAALQASRAPWSPSPSTKPIARQLATYTSPQRFKEGLSYILDGAGHQAARPPQSSATKPTKPAGMLGAPGS